MPPGLDELRRSWDPTGSLGAAVADFYVATTGNDSNDGSIGSPWLTIQKAADTLVAGEIVDIRGGTYTSQGATSSGVKPVNSGTAGNRITYRAFSGETPIIDQLDAKTGITIHGKSYITIDGLEIKNCTEGGIYARDGQGTNDNLVIQNNNVHDIDGSAGQNVAAILLSNVSNSLIENNIGTTIRVDGVNNANGGGIVGFRVWNTTVENNTFSDTYNGVYLKFPDDATIGNVIVRYNLLHDLSVATKHSTQSPRTGAHLNHQIYQNISYNTPVFYEDHTFENSSPSSGAKVYNNTIHVTTGNQVIFSRGGQTMEFYNNIIYSGESAPEWMHTLYNTGDKTDSSKQVSDISFCDYNCLYPNMTAQLGEFSDDDQSWANLIAWQAATGETSLSYDNPDTNSIDDDPLFVNPATRDYHLQGASPVKLIGRSGENMGAYITGSETIGAS